ncbi:MAG: hypothetical protein ACK56F_11825, partial [bacterium]
LRGQDRGDEIDMVHAGRLAETRFRAHRCAARGAQRNRSTTPTGLPRNRRTNDLPAANAPRGGIVMG